MGRGSLLVQHIRRQYTSSVMMGLRRCVRTKASSGLLLQGTTTRLPVILQEEIRRDAANHCGDERINHTSEGEFLFWSPSASTPTAVRCRMITVSTKAVLVLVLSTYVCHWFLKYRLNGYNDSECSTSTSMLFLPIKTHPSFFLKAFSHPLIVYANVSKRL